MLSRQNIRYYLLLGSILLYSVGIVLSIPTLSFAAFLFFSLAVFEIFMKNKVRSNRYALVVILLLIYVLFSFLFTINFTYLQIRQSFLDQYFLLPYLSVMLCMINYDSNILRPIKNILILSGVLYLILIIANFQVLLNTELADALSQLNDEKVSFDNISKRFCYPVGFLLFILPVLRYKEKLLVFVVFSLNLVLSIYLARRNIIFVTSLFCFFALYNVITYSNITSKAKAMLKVASIILIFVIGYHFIVGLKSNESVYFEKLASRIDVDTRGIVTESFYREMNQEKLYWIFGKGIYSSYYCPNVQDNPYREVVETGWHQIILKIGLLGLFALLVLFCSVFKKRNKYNLIRSACSFYVLVYVIELLIAGVPTFDLRWILLWIFISIYSSSSYDEYNHLQVRLL